MKGKRILPLVALAAMSLVACGPKQGGSSIQPSNDPSSNSSVESPSVESKSEKHVHNFQENSAESSGKLKVMECAEHDAKYLKIAVADADEGSTGVADGSESADKFGKGQSFKWTIKLKKNYKVNFQLGFKLSSSSHGDRKFQTYAEGASSSDSFESNSANDGTQRYWLLVNGERVEVTNTKTYSENNMGTDSFTEVELIDSLDLKAGKNVLEFCSHASTGYRLFVGGDVLMDVLEESEPHAHDLEAIEHEKGEGEVAVEAKKCKVDDYYEVSWSATDEAATSQGFTNGKFGKVDDYVEYKVWSPIAMNARLYAYGTYNKSNVKGVDSSEHHTVWYDWRADHDGYKTKIEVNGEEIDQDAQVAEIDGEEISIKDLNFPDLGYQASSEEVLEMPWVNVPVSKGANVIRITRTHGYGHAYQKFTLKRNYEAIKTFSYDDLIANRSEGDWGDKQWDDIGVKAFKVNVANGTFSLTYNSPKAQSVALDVYIACKFSNASNTGFWKQGSSAKTEVKVNGVEIKDGIEPDFSACVESGLSDNGKLSYPIYATVAYIDLVEGENTIEFKYLTGGYSYHLSGARLMPGKPAIVIPPLAQPVGEYHGMAKAADGSFIPVDLSLAADKASLNINGSTAGVSAYKWDGKALKLELTAAEAYGTISAEYDVEKNAFGGFALTGAAAATLDATYAVVLSSNCQFIDCSVMTLDQMNEMFVRRYDRNDGSGWQINKPSDGRISVATKEERTGLQCNGFSSGKVGFTLKNDLATPIPGSVIKSLGCWIYNPGETSFQMKLFAYKSANRATNGQLNTFTIQPGWHFYQTGVVNGSSFLSTDSFYNFQFYYENVSVNPIFDDLCIYM